MLKLNPNILQRQTSFRVWTLVQPGYCGFIIKLIFLIIAFLFVFKRISRCHLKNCKSFTMDHHGFIFFHHTIWAVWLSLHALWMNRVRISEDSQESWTGFRPAVGFQCSWQTHPRYAALKTDEGFKFQSMFQCYIYWKHYGKALLLTVSVVRRREDTDEKEGNPNEVRTSRHCSAPKL